MVAIAARIAATVARVNSDGIPASVSATKLPTKKTAAARTVCSPRESGSPNQATSAPALTAIQNHSRAVRGRDTSSSIASGPRKKTGKIGTATIRNAAVSKRWSACDRRPFIAGAVLGLVSRRTP